MKRLIPLFVLAGIVALVVALSSGGSKNQSANAHAGGAYGGKSNAAAPAGAAIDVRSTALGRTLVDAKGRTLYLFEADKPNVSNCSGACLSIWPPLTSGAKPQAKGGVLAAKIGTISSTGGKEQVTYGGHPLYYYVGDQKPGDTKGQGLNQFGAEWYVLAPTGNKIDHG
jgi:predicted lipoprotein with Yx(FWY)xxD motif